MRRRPVQTTTSMPLPSPTVASSDGDPARGTIRSDEISPATVISWRGEQSPMGVTPVCLVQKVRSCSLSSSATGTVSSRKSLRNGTAAA